MTVASPSPSVLPSPPTSPISPRTATTRIRIKPRKRPGSSDDADVSVERTRTMLSSLSRIVTTEPERSSSVASPSPRVATNTRRQSSITYYTPTSPSPWSQRHRTLASSVDSVRDEPVLVNGKENVSQRSSLVLTSRSSSTRESVSSADGLGPKEREPLTLIEKHTDLLHFIAQKERKCLELRDQLAAHEKELAELKRKWEHIVGGGQDLPNPPLSTGIGGVALDGLKEGVRLIAAGFSDLSGVIHEFDTTDDQPTKPLTYTPHEHPPNIRTHRKRSHHLSMSAVAFSIHEAVHGSEDEGEIRSGSTRTGTVATAPSLSRASSLNHRHKRTSRILSIEDPTPLDMTISSLRTPSPTRASPLTSPTGPSPSWVDTMGRKLGGLSKSPTSSRSQTRASSFLAGVSSTLTFAFSPGPTATTPAPLPTRARAPCPRLAHAEAPLHSHPSPTYGTMMDWLEDEAEGDGEHTAVFAVLEPSQPSPSHVQARTSASDATDVVSSFDDDTDWNW